MTSETTTTEFTTKPTYTLRELAGLFKRSKDSLTRLLVEAGVEWTWAGNKREVAITELEEKLETAWKAAVAVARREARFSSRDDA